MKPGWLGGERPAELSAPVTALGRGARLVRASVVATMFLSLTADGLRTWFSGDDLMNLGQYVMARGHLLWGAVAFYSPHYYRPLGGLIYLALYDAFGFVPGPFRIFAMCLLCTNLFLAYRVARTLLQSEALAFLAILLTAYHARMNNLYYNFGTIYELACFTCFYLGFLLYLDARRREGHPGPQRTLAISTLMVLALDAKEMGVTFPLILLAYEIVYHGAGARPRALARTLVELAPYILLAGVFAVGKVQGPEALSNAPMYRPSLQNYLPAMTNYTWQLLDVRPEVLGASRVVLGYASAIVLGFVLRSRAMLFGLSVFLIGLLPAALILPRSGYVLYIPILGCGLFLAGLLQNVFSRAQQAAGRWPRAARWLSAEGLGLFLLLTIPIWLHNSARKAVLDPHVKELIRMNRDFYESWRRTGIKPRPSARILLLDDPFPDNIYDPYFLLVLSEHDSSLEVHRIKQRPPTVAADPDTFYDYVLDYRFHELVVLKTPVAEAPDLPARLTQALAAAGLAGPR